MDDTIEGLLEGVARRESQAFRLLYDRASPKLLGVALRILKRRESAEDVVQDVFVKLWNGQAVFNAELGSGFSHAAVFDDGEKDEQIAQSNAATDLLLPLDESCHKAFT